MCVAIARYPSSEWILLSTVAVKNNLILYKKSRKSGKFSFVVLRSCGRTKIQDGENEISVPSFMGAYPVLTLVMETGAGLCGKAVGIRVMDYKPVFSLVQSESGESHHSGHSCSIINSELFRHLFGLEFQISNAPVLLIGCQNGNIYFTNFMSCSGQPQGEDLLHPLYTLEQPVLGIHVAYFPKNKALDAEDTLYMIQQEGRSEHSLETGAPNSIIFLGQRGKIAICHISHDEQAFPDFVEFHVPSPIISSLLVPNTCLLYSTLQGLYQICLRDKCLKSLEDKLPTLGSKRPIRIPEFSFKFPEKISESGCARYLLQYESVELSGASSTAQQDDIQCSCLSLDGRIGTFRYQARNGQDTMCAKKDSTKVGQEIRQCLQGIETLGDKIDHLKEKIHSLNSILRELKNVLDILCAMGEESNSKASNTLPVSNTPGIPFSCSFESTSEEVGVTMKNFCTNVTLSYNKFGSNEPLCSGWTFLVTSSSSSGNSVSKSVPIAGMSPGSSVTMRIDLELSETKLMDHSIDCFIHYSPQLFYQRLSSSNNSSTLFNPQTFKSITIFLCKKSLNLLDYLQPDTSETSSTVEQRLVKSILLSTETNLSPSTKPATSLLSLPIPVDTALSVIQASTGQHRMNTEEIGTKLLETLFPSASRKLKVGMKSLILFTPFGSKVSFKISPPNDSAMFNLAIHASSKSCLVQVMNSIMKRLDTESPNHSSEVAETRAQFSGQLMRLRKLLQEVSSVQQEFSSAYHETKTNCKTLDEFDRISHSLKNKTFSLFCKLREM